MAIAVFAMLMYNHFGRMLSPFREIGGVMEMKRFEDYLCVTSLPLAKDTPL